MLHIRFPLTFPVLWKLDEFSVDLQVNKSLSFLDSSVQESLQKGAKTYIPGNKRHESPDVTRFRSRDQQEASSINSLRFEAYDLPKPQPVLLKPKLPSDSNLSSAEQSYSMNHSASLSYLPASESGEVKLRLKGVQRKWGRPTYTSEPGTSQQAESLAPTSMTSQYTSSDLRKPLA